MRLSVNDQHMCEPRGVVVLLFCALQTLFFEEQLREMKTNKPQTMMAKELRVCNRAPGYFRSEARWLQSVELVLLQYHCSRLEGGELLFY